VIDKFYQVNKVLDWLRDFKFEKFKIPDEIQCLEPVEEGFGKGLFAIISVKVMKFLYE
jgi:hypothetical protein